MLTAVLRRWLNRRSWASSASITARSWSWTCASDSVPVTHADVCTGTVNEPSDRVKPNMLAVIR